jgi:hypothetical protein
MPKARREEVRRHKEMRREFTQVKKQKMALKRRMKLIQQGWRNGIVGVEGPDDQAELEISQGPTEHKIFNNHK